MEILNPARTQSHNPLFQVLLALENTSRYEFAAAGIAVKRVPATTRTAKFDLRPFPFLRKRTKNSPELRRIQRRPLR